MNTHIKGQKGEDIAAQYLKKNGYTILQRNYRCHYGEIDIVAKHKTFVVFVEVKSRSSDNFGAPREAVDAFKQKTIVMCATSWLLEHKLTGTAVRFDVVEVTPQSVNLIEDAFRA